MKKNIAWHSTNYCVERFVISFLINNQKNLMEQMDFVQYTHLNFNQTHLLPN